MATQALSIFYVRANGFTKILPQSGLSVAGLVAAFAAGVGDCQRAALASVSVRGAILHGTPQAAQVAALEIGRGRGMRQENAAHFTWRTAIYNWFRVFWFWFFWFWVFDVSADNFAVLYERFERSEIFGWDI